MAKSRMGLADAVEKQFAGVSVRHPVAGVRCPTERQDGRGPVSDHQALGAVLLDQLALTPPLCLRSR